MLDIASGGGDIPIRLWHRVRRAGVRVEIEGCDVNPQAVEYARGRAGEARADVRFFHLDALHDSLPPDYDVLTSSLFLHHLSDAEAVDFLRRLARATQQLVLINDLIRGRAELALAHVACRLLTTSRVVHTDGPRSIEAAFTMPEALALAQQAGLAGATVGWRWPCRYLLSWRRP